MTEQELKKEETMEKRNLSDLFLFESEHRKSVLEGQDEITRFNFWFDKVTEEALPNPGRYESAYRGACEEETDTPFYYMFMGFVGALDLVAKYDQLVVTVHHKYYADDSLEKDFLIDLKTKEGWEVLKNID